MGPRQAEGVGFKACCRIWVCSASELSFSPGSRDFSNSVCLFISRQRDKTGGTEVGPGEAAEDSDEADKGEAQSRQGWDALHHFTGGVPVNIGVDTVERYPDDSLARCV